MAYGTLSVDSLLNSPTGLNINGGFVTANVNSLGAGLVPAEQFYRLDSALVGANVATAQNILGVGVTLVGSTVYQFEAYYVLTKTAGATSHTIGLGFGGTATLNNITCQGTAQWGGGSLVGINSAPQTFYSNVATNTTTTAAIATATYYYYTLLRGTVSVNAGGTFIPQYSLSAAPGGAYTTAIGSYFKISPLGAIGSNTSIGTWA